MNVSEPVAADEVLSCDVAVVGAGPAGLMVAEQLAQSGLSVHVFEAKASVARKFLLAGKGGLNLTHSEDFASFVTRYGERAAQLRVTPTMHDDLTCCLLCLPCAVRDHSGRDHTTLSGGHA